MPLFEIIAPSGKTKTIDLTKTPLEDLKKETAAFLKKEAKKTKPQASK
jgi:hypothetical protein